MIIDIGPGTERIPREKDATVNRHRLDASACRLDSDDDRWHVMYAAVAGGTWRGVQILKNAFDLRRYFEILRTVRPAVIVETGMQAGGSALFFMDSCLLLGLGQTRYFGIDIEMQIDPQVDAHPAPHVFIKGDCLDPAVVTAVASRLAGQVALVVLDSVHSKIHVDEELRLYAPLCSYGSYLVVEDTDHGGRPAWGNYGPSAGESVDEFFASSRAAELGFTRDGAIERMFGACPFTNSPGAWLVRRG